MNLGKFTIYLSSICLGFLLASCGAELPFPEEGEPVFCLSMKLEGEAIEWEAGREGWIMETDWQRNSEGLRLFRGTFENLENRERESFSISFTDLEANGSGPIDESQVFALKRYSYTTQLEEGGRRNTFFFRAKSSGKAPLRYEWDFGDGNISDLPNPVHQYENSGIYTVNLGIRDASGCRNYSQRRLRVGQDYSDCQVSIAYELQGEGSVNFEALYDKGEQPEPTFVWSMGDGNAVVDQAAFNYRYDHISIYEVKLVGDFEGRICSDTKNIFPKNGASCASFIEYRVLEAEAPLGRVKVEYIDGNGRRYSNERFLGQPSSSEFRLLEVESYEINPSGQQTLKLNLAFDLRLYAEDDESEVLVIEEGKAVIGVALP